MWLVMSLEKSLSTTSGELNMCEGGVIGCCLVFKTKKDAKKYAKNIKAEIVEIETIEKQ